MEFLSLSRRRSSWRNVPSSEERGETDVFAGYTYWISIDIAGKNVVKLVTKTRQVWKWYACNIEQRLLRKSFENLQTFIGLGVGTKPIPAFSQYKFADPCQSSINHSQIGDCVVLRLSFKWCWQIFANWSMSKLKNNSYQISVFRGILKVLRWGGIGNFIIIIFLEGTNMGRLKVSSRLW